ncbi:hypothetical protein E2C01_094070 [Portunus trituberculatus]|uniref:Uncharacterized protein n=1 Tax=Portunus trituberculatus TaxID=210409 RepID=A0A5B7JPG1_PORTR|nr:hypothetical protein [Portunus trituberculatus]
MKILRKGEEKTKQIEDSEARQAHIRSKKTERQEATRREDNGRQHSRTDEKNVAVEGGRREAGSRRKEGGKEVRSRGVKKRCRETDGIKGGTRGRG